MDVNTDTHAIRPIKLTKKAWDTIDNLPQIKSGEWDESYLLNLLVLNWLEIGTDYDLGDLDLVKEGRVIE